MHAVNILPAALHLCVCLLRCLCLKAGADASYINDDATAVTLALPALMVASGIFVTDLVVVWLARVTGARLSPQHATLCLAGACCACARIG